MHAPRTICKKPLADAYRHWIEVAVPLLPVQALAGDFGQEAALRKTLFAGQAPLGSMSPREAFDQPAKLVIRRASGRPGRLAASLAGRPAGQPSQPSPPAGCPASQPARLSASLARASKPGVSAGRPGVSARKG